MSHRLQCACGRLRGEVEHPRQAVRAVCYCTDCQAYAHLLQRADSVLDAAGGTDVVATVSRNVRITQGGEHFACVSLSPRGLLRWYASCCGTPVANTPRDAKLAYAGLVHTCLERPEPMARAFPRVHLRAQTKSAHGPVPHDTGLAGKLHFARTAWRLALARVTGGWRHTPFFDAHGAPLVQPRVAAREEVDAARAKAARA